MKNLGSAKILTERLVPARHGAGGLAAPGKPHDEHSFYGIKQQIFGLAEGSFH
jgi:hypothetical protein